jgi:hypothetical protein
MNSPIQRESNMAAFGACRKSAQSAVVQPLKIRRSMTFNCGSNSPPAITSVLHPPVPDPFFIQSEPLIPSFHEEGKDMIRRITTSTVTLH